MYRGISPAAGHLLHDRLHGPTTAGVQAGEEVTHAEVIRVFANNIERLKALLSRVIGALPAEEPDATATCACRRVHDGVQLPFELP